MPQGIGIFRSDPPPQLPGPFTATLPASSPAMPPLVAPWAAPVMQAIMAHWEVVPPMPQTLVPTAAWNFLVPSPFLPSSRPVGQYMAEISKAWEPEFRLPQSMPPNAAWNVAVPPSVHVPNSIASINAQNAIAAHWNEIETIDLASPSAPYGNTSNNPPFPGAQIPPGVIATDWMPPPPPPQVAPKIPASIANNPPPSVYNPYTRNAMVIPQIIAWYDTSMDPRKFTVPFHVVQPGPKPSATYQQFGHGRTKWQFG